MEAGIKEQKQEHHQEIVKGGVSAFITRVIGLSINWVFTFITARVFHASGTGIYQLSLLVLNFFGTIGKLGSDTLMTRFTAQYRVQNKRGEMKDLFNKSMLISVPLSLLLTVAMYASSTWLATSWFEKPDDAIYFQIASIILMPLTVFAITNGGLRGLKKIKEYTFLINVSPYLFGTLALAGLLLFEKSTYVIVIAYEVGITITCVIALFWWFKYSKYFETKITESFAFKEKFWIGMSLFIAALFSLVRGWTDTAIIGKFLTNADVGIYRTAFKVAILTRITLSAILVPAAPKFAELFSQGKMKELAKSAQFATKIIFWTSAPVLLVTMLVPELILSVFGPEFKAGWLVLIILSVGQFINSATGPVSNILNMTGKQKINRNLTVIATVIGITLDYLLIPRYGIVAAAWVNTLGVCIMNLVPLFLVRYYYGFYTLDFKDLFNIKPKEFLKEAKELMKKEKKKKTEGDEAIADDMINNAE